MWSYGVKLFSGSFDCVLDRPQLIHPAFYRDHRGVNHFGLNQFSIVECRRVTRLVPWGFTRPLDLSCLALGIDSWPFSHRLEAIVEPSQRLVGFAKRFRKLKQ